MRNMNNRNHLLGRIFLGLAILFILAVPVLMSIILQTLPDFRVIGISMLALIVFILGGFIEVITYSPMLGTSGTYLGFITGNLVNLKVPCAVNARELANAKHGSPEGEVISTISVATSTIVTTIIITIGVIALTPLTPVLKSPVLEPALGNAFTALFAALAYKYFIKDPILVPVPFTLALILAFAINGLGTAVCIPICSIVSILFALAVFKRMKKLDK